MTKSSVWIEAGYQWFAYEGPDNMKIDTLARANGLKRPNFYYYFNNLDNFLNKLLETHLERWTRHSGLIQRECREYYPDYIHLMLREKDFIFFQRRLAFRQDDPASREVFEKVNQGSISQVVPLWLTSFPVPDWDEEVVAKLFERMADRFYNTIDADQYSFEYLRERAREDVNLMKLFVDQEPFTPDELDRFFS